MGFNKRPVVVEKKEEIGDCEVDTIIGSQSKDVLITLVDRKSRFSLAYLSPNRSAHEVTKNITDMLMNHKNEVHTITTDNGKEFANHKEIACSLKAQFYFSHPYSPCKRGSNENTNGILRQYYLKKTDFIKIDRKNVSKVITNLNERPRKGLNYPTPAEVFFGQGKQMG